MINKRGLGRGLEALLTDVSSNEQTQAITKETEGQVIMAKSLVKLIQKEHSELLHEAEDLKQLLDEFEISIRHS